MNTFKTPDQSAAGPDTLAGSPGAILRRCREFHGISLEEASDTTKIGISHLRALEEDQIQEFANVAYLKGFLRIYATFLGLNSEDIARLYDKLFGVQPGKTEQVAKQQKSPRSSQKYIAQLKKLIFPAVLLTITIITAAFFKRPPAAPVRAALPAVAPQTIPGAAVQPVLSSATRKQSDAEAAVVKVEKVQKETVDTDETPTPKRAAEPAKSFILKIKVTQNGTMTATVDSGVAQQYDLTIGDIIEWKAEKKVALELSNAGGVDVELNGKPYKALGAPGKTAYVELDADGVKQ